MIGGKVAGHVRRPSFSRPIDIIAHSLQAGCGLIDPFLTARQNPSAPSHTNSDMGHLIAKLALTICAATANQAA
ncbi:hypothetical protein GQ600_5923 [Phytophthora cactorum]|nr:hypothetical protein GQ600_5923 [Phytophthora cactorum]